MKRKPTTWHWYLVTGETGMKCTIQAQTTDQVEIAEIAPQHIGPVVSVRTIHAAQALAFWIAYGIEIIDLQMNPEKKNPFPFQRFLPSVPQKNLTNEQPTA